MTEGDRGAAGGLSACQLTPAELLLPRLLQRQLLPLGLLLLC